ncbi:MAG: flavin reductase family protein [Clostridiales bacterium]|nr:flavin reductase family protein [Clostridiales bacterium]
MSKQQWKPGNMVYPLPAVMVSCSRPGEKPNIITVAWCGTVCTNPAMVSISVRPERYSYDILRETGEFVINLTTGDLNRAADYCGVKSGRDTDKFRDMRLSPQPSVHIRAPGIAESPVNIECRITEILPLGSHHMFLAQVMGVQVEERLLNEKGSLDLGKADLTAYSHGTYYHLGEAIGTFGYSVKKQSGTKSRGAKAAITGESDSRRFGAKETGTGESASKEFGAKKNGTKASGIKKSGLKNKETGTNKSPRNHREKSRGDGDRRRMKR